MQNGQIEECFFKHYNEVLNSCLRLQFTAYVQQMCHPLPPPTFWAIVWPFNHFSHYWDLPFHRKFIFFSCKFVESIAAWDKGLLEPNSTRKSNYAASFPIRNREIIILRIRKKCIHASDEWLLNHIRWA